jgi:hypothetical protein
MILQDQKIYDGSLIHSRFAYKYFKQDTSAVGNIVAFIAPAKVDTGLIDLEDALQKDYIFSDKMMHFCWELPCLSSSFGAVAFQRLFNTAIAEILSKYIEEDILVDGDDIMVNTHDQSTSKASVSITYCDNGVAIGHTGINIIAGSQAPDFAYSTELSEEDALKFMHEVISCFYFIANDMFIATTKISVPK